MTGLGLNQTLAVTYASNINAGTATASASYPGSANYLPSNGSQTFTIDAAATTTTVTCTAGPFTYTGSAIEPCTAAVTGPGLNQALAVTYAGNINAGTATASASYPGSANYLPSNGSQTFTIDAGCDDDDGDLYCGAVHLHRCGHRALHGDRDRSGGLNETLAVTYAGNVNAGTATASASYAGSANYLPSNDSQTFTIVQAATTTTVTCTAGPFTYTGAAIEPCTATVTGPGLNQTLAVTYAGNINAGTATASASYPGSANYLPSNGSRDLHHRRGCDDDGGDLYCGAVHLHRCRPSSLARRP